LLFLGSLFLESRLGSVLVCMFFVLFGIGLLFLSYYIVRKLVFKDLVGDLF